jgi:hypothetical protein
MGIYFSFLGLNKQIVQEFNWLYKYNENFSSFILLSNNYASIKCFVCQIEFLFLQKIQNL